MEKETEEARVSCNHPKCEKSTADYSCHNFVEHIARHIQNDKKITSQFSYRCSRCDEHFVSSMYARNHMFDAGCENAEIIGMKFRAVENEHLRSNHYMQKYHKEYCRPHVPRPEIDEISRPQICEPSGLNDPRLAAQAQERANETRESRSQREDVVRQSTAFPPHMPPTTSIPDSLQNDIRKSNLRTALLSSNVPIHKNIQKFAGRKQSFAALASRINIKEEPDEEIARIETRDLNRIRSPPEIIRRFAAIRQHARAKPNNSSLCPTRRPRREDDMASRISTKYRLGNLRNM